MRPARLACAAALLLCGTGARAQPATDFVADRYLTPPGPATVLAAEGGEVLGHLRMDGGVRFGAVARPFVVRETLTGEVAAVPVERALVLEAFAALGLTGRLQLGLAVPVTVHQTGDRLRGLADERGLAAVARGDLRLHAKWPVLAIAAGRGMVALALAPFLALPTGNADEFAGAGGVWGEARVAAGWQRRGVLVALDVGLRLRPRTELYGEREGVAAVAFALGAALRSPWRPLRRAALLVEVAGESYGAGRPMPVEARGGVRVRIWRGLSLALAGGAGLDHELGAPAWRALGEVRIEPVP